MKLQAKFILSLTFLMMTVMGSKVLAQGATSVQPSSNGDRQYKMDTTFSAHSIRDDDKMYQMAVWRRIDLREKYNLPLYGSGDIKDDGIITHIYNAVVDENALEVFADENFTEPLSISDFQQNFWIAANGDSVFVKNLYYLDLMEDFVFDKHRSQIIFDVKYLELVMPSETNSNAGQKTIGYIRYKDFYNHFKDHPEAKWLNFKNTSKHLSYSQAFDLRLFKAVVRKFYNPDNSLILDSIDPDHPNAALQAYLNSLEFEYGLLEWENSLWEW